MANDTKAKLIANIPGPNAFYKGPGIIKLEKHQYAHVYNTDWAALDKEWIKKKEKKKK